MTAAHRHRQSRFARLRGQLRPSDDRLVFSDRWARSLSGPSPACRSPVRLAARGPLACSPPPPRVPAPPRFPAPDGARAAHRRRALADRAAAAQAVAAPPRPKPSVRACRCRRRRRSTLSPPPAPALPASPLRRGSASGSVAGTLAAPPLRPRRHCRRRYRRHPPARPPAGLRSPSVHLQLSQLCVTGDPPSGATCGTCREGGARSLSIRTNVRLYHVLWPSCVWESSGCWVRTIPGCRRHSLHTCACVGLLVHMGLCFSARLVCGALSSEHTIPMRLLGERGGRGCLSAPAALSACGANRLLLAPPLPAKSREGGSPLAAVVIRWSH